MKKITKRITSVLMAVGLTTTLACFNASALDPVPDPSGYVTFAVEKFSVGQGYVVEPWLVPIYENDRPQGIDFLRSAVHYTSINTTTTGENVYVWGFTDTDTGKVELPDCLDGYVDENSLMGVADEKYLSEGDYTPESGFIFFLNGEPAPFGISEYEPKDGDVVRFSFTLYNYGADVGCDNSSWGGSESLIGDVNRDEATKQLAKLLSLKQENGFSPDVTEQLDVLCDLDSTQPEIDSVAATFERLYNEGNTDKPADTGFSVGVLLPALIGTCAIASKKRR